MGLQGVEVQAALDAVRGAGSILEAMRRAGDLADAAITHGGARAVRLLAPVAAGQHDQLTAIAAIHSLAPLPDASAGDALVALLESDKPFVREHAAWALGVRRPLPGALSGLVDMVAAGGFPGMIAERTLERWGCSAPEPVARALDVALDGARGDVAEAGARARLIETAGLVPARSRERLLRQVATDATEATEVRAAAIAALGDLEAHDAVIRMLTGLSHGDDVLADVARLALADLADPDDPAEPGERSRPAAGGETIAQLFLPADIDRELSQVGSGDNGGIATLLVRLGDALVGGDRAAASVDHVLTLSRGRPADALRGLADLASSRSGHVFATVPFLGEHVPSVDAWPRRVAAERGIRRILLRAGTVGAIHLRMADVGTLAAAAVARDLGIPVVFTLAPDPHAAIAALETAGELTRANFGTRDEQEHFWFRARLVHRVTAEAAHVVLFPRPELRRDLLVLLGFDTDLQPERNTVVPEGIDLAVIARAGSEALVSAQGETAHPAFDALDELLGALPAHRRGLPLLITVGRLHAVKGMATLVEAWLADTELRARCNLLIVGGDLEHPSAEERRQLDRIDAAVPRAEGPAEGLLLAGHRANDTVARWLAAARYGRPGLAAPHGVYVCASTKEEFGIALLEAMATGLTVVAPAGGGPATFVEHGVTGFLVDTRDTRSLAAGVVEALDLAAGPLGAAYAELAHDMVAQEFAIQTMADALTRVYRGVAHTVAHTVTPARKENAS